MTPIRIAPDVAVVYVDTLEALVALSQLTRKHIVWRRLPQRQEEDRNE